ncbi:MAG: hypothetical protein ACJLS3_06045 [Erythrobacter sp.]
MAYLHLGPMTPDQWDRKYPLIASNVFRNVATLAAVIVGFVGLGFQNHLANVSNAKQATQLQAQTFLTREMKYDDMWTGYMELAMDHPEFAEGADYNALSPADQIRYTWFFDRLAYTAEAILSLRHDDAKWQEIFDGEFRKHTSLLRDHPGIIRDWFCNYDDTVRPLIKGAIRGTGRAVPNCAARKAANANA